MRISAPLAWKGSSTVTVRQVSKPALDVVISELSFQAGTRQAL